MNFEEFLDYINNNPYSNYVPRRYIRDAQNPIEIYDDTEFIRRYRFNKNTVKDILLPMISNDQPNNRGLPLPPMIQLLIVLRFYATGNFQNLFMSILDVSWSKFCNGYRCRIKKWIVCGDLHKISQSVVSKIIANNSEKIANQLTQYVNFPVRSDWDLVKKNFYKIAGFPGVLGCIDCTHIPIKSPSRENGEVFRNRKGWFSLNVQLVCGPNMEIYDIVTRWPGSVHDSRIFANSRCSMRFDEGELMGILLGDGGYAQTSYMYTPLQNPQTLPEIKYNKAHIATRNIIERVNGLWKRRFACLSRKLQNNLKNTCNIVVACAVLHNVCVMTKEVIPEDLTLEMNDVPVDNGVQTERGSIIRNAFIIRHFT